MCFSIKIILFFNLRVTMRRWWIKVQNLEARTRYPRKTQNQLLLPSTGEEPGVCLYQVRLLPLWATAAHAEPGQWHTQQHAIWSSGVRCSYPKHAELLWLGFHSLHTDSVPWPSVDLNTDIQPHILDKDTTREFSRLNTSEKILESQNLTHVNRKR